MQSVAANGAQMDSRGKIRGGAAGAQELSGARELLECALAARDV